MKDLITYLLKQKKYWLIPVSIVLLLLAVIIVYAASTALSPFIYTLF